MNFTWYLHITPGHITAYKQLNFLFNYSSILLRVWKRKKEKDRNKERHKGFIFLTFDGVELNVQTENVFIQSITITFYETMKKKSFIQKFIFKKMPNLKRKLSTWIVFFTEIMVYSVKLINHILTFLVKMRADFLTIQPTQIIWQC